MGALSGPTCAMILAMEAAMEPVSGRKARARQVSSASLVVGTRIPADAVLALERAKRILAYARN
jgi:hypothetical protein